MYCIMLTHKWENEQNFPEVQKDYLGINFSRKRENPQMVNKKLCSINSYGIQALTVNDMEYHEVGQLIDTWNKSPPYCHLFTEVKYEI